MVAVIQEMVVYYRNRLSRSIKLIYFVGPVLANKRSFVTMRKKDCRRPKAVVVDLIRNPLKDASLSTIGTVSVDSEHVEM
jgi:hypothetical protein